MLLELFTFHTLLNADSTPAMSLNMIHRKRRAFSRPIHPLRAVFMMFCANDRTVSMKCWFPAVAFTAVQFMYLETQVFVTRLNGVYGTFAAIPLFMIWLNISWNIILMGAELSYAFQNVDTYNLED